MPIYEYHCPTCGNDFEMLVSRHTQPACPECASVEVKKQFSTFAAHGTTAQPTAPAANHGHGPGCGCCAPGGACGFGAN